MVSRFGTPQKQVQPKASFRGREPELAVGQWVQGYPNWLALLLVRHGQFKFDAAKIVSSEKFSNFRPGSVQEAPAKKAFSGIMQEIWKEMEQGNEKKIELMQAGWIRLPKCVRWRSPELNSEAVRGLAGALGKDPRDLDHQDFLSNCLSGLLAHHYKNSVYNAVSEAFPELGILAWEMATAPKGFFDVKENRVAALRWLVAKLNKDPREMAGPDFKHNRLWGVLHHHNNSPYATVSEAFPELKIQPWEMAMAPMGFFDKKKNRIAAVKWLVSKLKKDPSDITKHDFYSNSLAGLCSNQYQGSPYLAMLEAGFVGGKEEDYMRSHRHRG